MNADLITELIEAARRAAANAYAPYSRFGVGAALLLADGSIITGCNFENASYGLSLCAETVALATANASGRLRDVRAVAVLGGALSGGRITGGEPVYPCGRCLQMINEAAHVSGVDLPIYCASADGSSVDEHRLSALLPHAFGPQNLA